MLLGKRFPNTEPQPLYEWIPTSYDLDKKFSTYRGEKWLADQANFMMEMMKFQSNIRKESYRKGAGGFQAADGDYPTPPAQRPEINGELLDEKVWDDYVTRVKPYDIQYIGVHGIDQRHFNVNPHLGTDNTAFGVLHAFGRGSSKYKIQGFGEGEAVAENIKNTKKTQIYDFFMNFWDFSGSYKDYFHVDAADQNRSSFFVQPGDKYSAEQDYYRGDLKYDYEAGQESTQYMDRRYDAIPIYKPAKTWNIGGVEYFNSYNGGKDISGMSWDEFMRFYPTDFASSFFGRNPAILKDDDIASITGYDKINPLTGKTHFKEAVDYFSSYVSPRGKALQLKDDQKTYEPVDRAGFYDLMMDPNAPWNNGGDGTGWWADKNGSLEKMKTAFYIVILATEAKRRYLHSMTQWFGPGTQFQGFVGDGFSAQTNRIDKNGSETLQIYVPGSDDKMIAYFTSWYGNSCSQRGTGQQSSGNNPYWMAAEAPAMRAGFNDLFMTAGHEMGEYLHMICSASTYGVYSQVERDVSARFKTWLKTQFNNLMDPEKVKPTIFSKIHPDISDEKNKALSELNDFVSSSVDVSTRNVSSYTPDTNKFALEASLSEIADSNISASFERKSLSYRRNQVYDTNVDSSWPSEVRTSFRNFIYSNSENYNASSKTISDKVALNLSGLGNRQDSTETGETTIGNARIVGLDYLKFPNNRTWSYTHGEGEDAQTYTYTFEQNYLIDNSHFVEFEVKANLKANIQYEDGSAEFTKGHHIYTELSWNITNEEDSESVAVTTPNLSIREKTGADFRTAYANYLAEIESGDYAKEMSLSTYRTLAGDLSGGTTVDDYIHPDRSAHQLFVNKEDLSDAINDATSDNPELNRVLKGGAVAELFREYALEDTDFNDWRGDGTAKTDDENPYSTADYANMLCNRLMTKDTITNPNGNFSRVGGWYLSVGNLRKGQQDWDTSTPGNQPSGIYEGFYENWFKQYAGWNSFKINEEERIIGDHEFDGTPYENVWGLRVAYLMRNTSEYTVSFIIFQQTVFRQKLNDYREEKKRYKEQKYEEKREEAMEEMTELQKKAHLNIVMAEERKKKAEESQRVKKMVMKEEKNRKEQKQAAIASKARKTAV